MKHVTVTLTVYDGGLAKTSVLAGTAGDLANAELAQFFTPELRAVLNEIDPQTGSSSTNGCEAMRLSPVPEAADCAEAAPERERTAGLNFAEAYSWMERGYAIRYSLFQPGKRLTLVKTAGKCPYDSLVMRDDDGLWSDSWTPSHEQIVNRAWCVLLEPR